MNILAQQSTPLQSMTSLEIAELVDSRHDSVNVLLNVYLTKTLSNYHQRWKLKQQRKPVQVYVFSGEQGKLIVSQS